MEIFWTVVVFIYGLLIGSFLNVCIYRLPREESIVFPPSKCTKCGKKIKWWQNLPLFSYIILGGKCNYCKEKINFRYFLVELITALSLVLVFAYFGFSWKFFYYSLFTCLLVIVFFVDLEHQLILDEITKSGMVLGFIGSFFIPISEIYTGRWLIKAPFLQMPISSLFGILAGITFFWLIRQVGTILAKREAMGQGDIKLAGLIGAFLGWKLAMLSFFVAFFLGSLVAIPLVIFSKKGASEPVPFGTFMAMGAYMTVLWGKEMLYWYFNWPQLF